MHAEPDVLLIDEALAVGDAHFVQKCFTAFSQFQRQGVTILFVSHDMNVVRRFCQETIWLEVGTIIRRGEPKNIIDLYNAMVFERIAAKTQQAKSLSAADIASRKSVNSAQRFGTGAAEIVDMTLLNLQLRPVEIVTSGEETIFRIVVRFKDFVSDAVFGITIRDKRGLEVYGTNTLWKKSKLKSCRVGDVVQIDFRQNLMLGQGDYFVNVAVNEKRAEGLVRLDWIADVIKFSIVSDDEFMGFCNLNSEISVHFI